MPASTSASATASGITVSATELPFGAPLLLGEEGASMADRLTDFGGRIAHPSLVSRHAALLSSQSAEAAQSHLQWLRDQVGGSGDIHIAGHGAVAHSLALKAVLPEGGLAVRIMPETYRSAVARRLSTGRTGLEGAARAWLVDMLICEHRTRGLTRSFTTPVEIVAEPAGLAVPKLEGWPRAVMQSLRALSKNADDPAAQAGLDAIRTEIETNTAKPAQAAFGPAEDQAAWEHLLGMIADTDIRTESPGDDMGEALAASEAARQAMLDSTSWRLTAPLRRIVSAIRPS